MFHNGDSMSRIFTWQGGGGDFADPTRWLDTNGQPGVPGPGDIIQFLPFPGAGLVSGIGTASEADAFAAVTLNATLSVGTLLVNVDGAVTIDGATVTAAAVSDDGTMVVTGDTARLNAAFPPGGNGGAPNGAMLIGAAGTGTFTQGQRNQSDPNNAVTVAGDLVLGQQPGAVGTYTLNIGTLTVGGQLAVGGQGTTGSTFTQLGGTVDLTGSASGDPNYVSVGPGFAPFPGVLAVGGGIGTGDNSDSGGSGSYSLSRGTISAIGILVGATGTGSFSQSGGTITALSETEGYAGTGTFNQIGGANDIVTTLTLGSQDGSTGAYNLSGGSLTAGGNVTIGDAGAGQFSQSGGTAAFAADLVLGNQVFGTGTYTMDNGSLSIGGLFLVGGASLGANRFAQTGGTVTVTGAAAADPAYTSAGGFNLAGMLFVGGALGDVTGGTGDYTLSGGTLFTSSTWVGFTGTGTFEQSGGIVTTGGMSLGGSGFVGHVPPAANASSGAYALLGGVLSIAGDLQVSYFGNATFTQGAGTRANIGGTAVLGVGSGTGAEGIYNLQGGLLTVGQGITVASNSGNDTPGATGTFVQTGGLVTLGGWYDGQILANGQTTAAATATLIVGEQAGSTGFYALGRNGQSNTASWGGYPGQPDALTFPVPPLFDDVNNAPYLQLYGNAVIGMAAAGKDSNGNPVAGAQGTFTLAGDGSVLRINSTIGTSGNGSLAVGQGGTGTFTQSGASVVTLDGGLSIGRDQGGTGSYTMDAAGTLSAGTVVVGDNGSGTFLQGGNTTVTITGELDIGRGLGTGLYALSATAVLTVGGSIVLGLGGNKGTMLLHGTTLTTSGGIQIDDSISTLSGSGTVNAAVINNGLLEAAVSGQTLEINGTVSGIGAMLIDADATLRLDQLPVNTQTVTFGSVSRETLVLGAPGSGYAGAIVNLGLADRIELGGGLTIVRAQAVAGGLSIQLGGGGTYDLTHVTYASGITPSFVTGFDAANNAAFVEVVCFAAGTRLSTRTGTALVEDLRAGDHVFTLSGEARKVKWVGRRRIDLVRHPHAEHVAPIRFKPGAIADNVPSRELLLSPDHGVFLDGMLIPARLLVNHGSITQDLDRASITYFHVELDTHDILAAERLLVESYLDTGNRGFFTNDEGPMTLHPDLTAPRVCREQGSCAPVAVEPAAVAPVWAVLRDRAEALGMACPLPETTGEPDLHLLAGDRALRPAAVKEQRYVFVPPRGETQVRIVSRAARPNAARPWIEDRRLLGVRVNRILLRDAVGLTEIPIDHPALPDGWWAPERDGSAMARWTNGDAMLTIPEGTIMVEIHLAETMRYPIEGHGTGGPDQAISKAA